MTFPALLSLPDDPVIGRHPTAQRIYLKLLGLLDFTSPRDVKAWGIAESLNVRRQTAYACLDLLVERGFLTEHGRRVARHNVPRRFTLTWSLLAPERTMPEDGSDVSSASVRHVE